MTTKNFDLLIVGGGVSGTALLYTLMEYSNIPKMALLEKYDKVATVNSARTHNSQTLHFGDIETNYTYKKAEQVKATVDYVKNYVENRKKANDPRDIFRVYSKMVLAVGEKQVEFLEKRYEEFKNLFPKLKKIGREEIAKLEPKVIEGRDPKEALLALVTDEGYTVDFAALAESFVEQAQKKDQIEGTQRATLFFHHKVEKIEKNKEGYKVITSQGDFQAKVVVVAAGGHSLYLAQSLGYGKEYALLSIAGSFFWAPKMLNGKVYTIQVDKLPFAAVHGDPEVFSPEQTRFGPTAKAIPLLERYNWSSLPEYFKVFGCSLATFQSFFNILSDGIVFRYILKNFFYDIPFLGKYLFLQEVRKVVPTIKYSELRYAKGMGGTRPQIVNTKTKKLEMGEAKITGDNIIFNITPSPGASTCLGNAYKDAEMIVSFFGNTYTFDKERFKQEVS